MKLSGMFIFAATFAVAGAVSIYEASAQVVALGASNTQGYGVNPSEAFPAQLGQMVHMQVTNAGVYGDTTGGMLARLSSSVPEGTKIVILQFGGNDNRQGVSPAARQANINSIEQKLRARGIRIVQADAVVNATVRLGMAQSDHIHLTAQGHQKVAASLARAIR